MKSRHIKIDYLARVEGEGGLRVKIKDNKVSEVKLDIFEPPRFFEAFLRGRHYTEAPDVTARICGICPTSYQIAAAQAMENALGLTIDPQIRALRKLIMCGSWIQSHALHIYMLHAPDFLGHQDALQMSKGHPDAVKRGLKLKKIGNEIVALLGGREIHPVNIRFGGFYKAPSKAELIPLVEKLKWAREAALETVRWTSTFSFPAFDPEYEFVALRHPSEYPLNEGSITSNYGIGISPGRFENFFGEKQVDYSTALQSFLKAGGNYTVGPLARYNINFDCLSSLAKKAARSAGISSECRNPFKSIIVRGVEIVQACEDALQIIENYEPPENTAIELKQKASDGLSCVEAPRGLLYHHYQLDDQGLIVNAKIVSPTAQNQKNIEQDIEKFVEKNLDLPNEELAWKCEQAIRNYDPCISCATHRLKVKIERD